MISVRSPFQLSTRFLDILICIFFLIAGLGLISFAMTSLKGWTEVYTLDPERRVDFEKLVERTDDANVLAAAVALFQRADVYQVQIRRGSSNDKALEISLRKPSSGGFLGYDRDIAGFWIKVAYLTPSEGDTKNRLLFQGVYFGLMMFGIMAVIISCFWFADLCKKSSRSPTGQITSSKD